MATCLQSVWRGRRPAGPGLAGSMAAAVESHDRGVCRLLKSGVFNYRSCIAVTQIVEQYVSFQNIGVTILARHSKRLKSDAPSSISRSLIFQLRRSIKPLSTDFLHCSRSSRPLSSFSCTFIRTHIQHCRYNILLHTRFLTTAAFLCNPRTDRTRPHIYTTLQIFSLVSRVPFVRHSFRHGARLTSLVVSEPCKIDSRPHRDCLFFCPTDLPNPTHAL